MAKVGFDFDEFGGNVDIVIVAGDPETLNNSQAVNSLQTGAGQFNQLQGQTWSFFNPLSISRTQLGELAQALSQELATKAIYFFFGDASGWMGYQFFENGNECEEYSFGINYDEEMLEMGQDPSQTRRPGAIVATNEEGEQFIFWSQLCSKAESEICGRETFIDEFLSAHNAYIGWDLFPAG